MNLSEFKAWFEGFTDGMESNPTEKQWEKIKARVAEIKAEPTPPAVIYQYMRDYGPYRQLRNWPYETWCAANSIAGNMAAAEKLYAGDGGAAARPDPALWQFNTLEAVEGTFRAMGAADRASLQ